MSINMRLENLIYPKYQRDHLIANNDAQDQRMCLVFSPFKPEFDIILNECIKPVADEMKLWVYRVDNSVGSAVIMKEILVALFHAGQVIVDISGHNPNVMYELGLAHCFKDMHEVIILKNEVTDLPFDINHIRVINYSINEKVQLKNDLEKCMRDIIKMRSSSDYSNIEEWKQWTP